MKENSAGVYPVYATGLFLNTLKNQKIFGFLVYPGVQNQEDEATEARKTKARRHGCPVKRTQDERALLQKHARQKNARLIGPRQKSGRYIGLRQDSAGQLGLLYLIIHLRHVDFLLYEYWILRLKKSSIYTFTHLKHCIFRFPGLKSSG